VPAGQQGRWPDIVAAHVDALGDMPMLDGQRFHLAAKANEPVGQMQELAGKVLVDEKDTPPGQGVRAVGIGFGHRLDGKGGDRDLQG
jgi:hypothetical protein